MTKSSATGRPIDLAPCPGEGCPEMISRNQIACKACWRGVPGRFKTKLSATSPGTTMRKRAVADIRAYLQGRDEQASDR